jgi:hypothetical protein
MRMVRQFKTRILIQTLFSRRIKQIFLILSNLKQSKIIAMLPARIGNTRLKMKNLALIDSKPMIYYTIKAAQGSEIFDRIILNSDSRV